MGDRAHKLLKGFGGVLPKNSGKKIREDSSEREAVRKLENATREASRKIQEKYSKKPKKK